MSSKRIVYLDMLRSFAAFTVVFLHTAAPFLYYYEKKELSFWMTANIYDGIVRWSVPIFFMMSGALLLGAKRELSLSDFFKKRMDKILIPFLFWSVFYFYFRAYYLDTDNSFKTFIKKFLNDDISYHLWFFYAMIGVYLIFPLLRPFVKNSSITTIGYIVGVWAIFTSGFSYINYLLEVNLDINTPLGLYVGYFLLGYLLTQINFNKVTRIGIYTLGIIGLFITVYFAYLDTVETGNVSLYYFKYITPNVLITSVAVFVFFKYAFANMNNTPKVINTLSFTTFGIYVIHPFYILILSKQNIVKEFIFDHVAIAIPVFAIIVFILSAVTAYIISKLPIIKRII